MGWGKKRKVDRQRALRREYRRNGLCIDCGQPGGGRARCDIHRLAHNAWARQNRRLKA